MLWVLYISLSALRHSKNTDLTHTLDSSGHGSGDGGGEEACREQKAVAPSARSVKKSGANRNRPNARKIEAKPGDMATLRMDRPSSPQDIRRHSRRRALHAKIGQMT